MTWNPADLASLAAKVADRQHTESAIAADVRWLRKQGCPWSVIAEELGTSKQAAQQRYAPRQAPADTTSADAELPFA